jgi:hypothetical protein
VGVLVTSIDEIINLRENYRNKGISRGYLITITCVLMPVY